MKRIPFLIVVTLLVLGACSKKSDPEPDPQAIQLELLSKTWKTKEVLRDGVAQTGYSGFNVSISGTPGAGSFGYSTTGRPSKSPWPANGLWKFGTPLESTIVRDPGGANELTMTYVVTDTQLQLIFQFAGSGFDGRSQNVTGQWTFNMTAQ